MSANVPSDPNISSSIGSSVSTVDDDQNDQIQNNNQLNQPQPPQPNIDNNDNKPDITNPNNINNNNNDNNTKINNKPKISVEYGHCSKQGIRPTMEDQVVIESSFIVSSSLCTSGYHSLFGVFDGHGGKQCAEYCSLNFCNIFRKYLLICNSITTAFNQCIKELDANALKHATDASGSTCCIILIDLYTSELWVCNVGDSRCILINHLYSEVIQLSIEHKPDYPKEKLRIENANGWVTFGRVCGILAVSRSLGDKDFKTEIENLIISTPDITHQKINLNYNSNQSQYIILACDGLYDVFTNIECMKWLQLKSDKSDKSDLQTLTESLAHDAIYVKKSKDNVSIVIVKLNHINDDDDDDDDDDDVNEIKQNDNDNNHDNNSNNIVINSLSSSSSSIDISNSSSQDNKHHHRSKFHVTSVDQDNDNDNTDNNIKGNANVNDNK